MIQAALRRLLLPNLFGARTRVQAPWCTTIRFTSLAEVTIGLLLLLVEGCDEGLGVLRRVLVLKPHRWVVLTLKVRVMLILASVGVLVAATVQLILTTLSATEPIEAVLVLLGLNGPI